MTNPHAIVLYAGLINWLVTVILVEGKLLEPLRHRIGGWVEAPTKPRWEVEHWITKIECIRHYRSEVGGLAAAKAYAEERVPAGESHWTRPKLAYLVQCHLCTGTWVGFGLALLIPGPFWLFLLNGLLYKAIGHIILCVTNCLER